MLLAFATVSCEDSTRPTPPGGGPSQVTATYVCGNDFDLVSGGADSLTVQYQVSGTNERGELLLPPHPPGSPTSTTRLTTLQPGTVEVSSEGQSVATVENAAATCAPSSAPEPRSTLGEWTAPFDWPVVAVHLHLLPDGRVLSWGRAGAPQLWSPGAADFIGVPSSTMVFCSGHAFLPDGRLLVTGGHLDDDRGLPDANIFDGRSGAWLPVTPMSRGRWYPTSTTLSDGEVLTLAGRDETGAEVEVPEIWTGAAWRALPGASRTLPYYPRMFVAPNGLVFYAGELPASGYLDPTGDGAWIPAATSRYGRRDYGSAAMYRPGKVMIVGGSDPPDGAPTSSAEVIDLNDAAPAWRYTAAMAFPRRQFNTTLLPDGQVLATGGTSAAGFSDPAGGIHAAEVWDPATEQWSTLASNQVTRVYHSTTILLPDGRVLHAGSGDGVGLPRELSAEIFSPPYLFRGDRPSIRHVPDAVGYGERFFVATPEAGQVIRATIVRLGSVTHGFDQNQRFLELSFERTAGGLTVTAPVSPNLAPPGHYLLFILNGAGVPSVAKTVKVQ